MTDNDRELDWRIDTPLPSGGFSIKYPTRVVERTGSKGAHVDNSLALPGMTELVGEANNLRREVEAKTQDLARETARAAEADSARIRLIVRLSQDAMFKRATESEDRELALIDAVRDWAMRNEIAAPPLDWVGLGALLDPTAASTPPASAPVGGQAEPSDATVRLRRFAEAKAITARALGRDDERDWLDVLAIIERVAPGEPSDAQARAMLDRARAIELAHPPRTTEYAEGMWDAARDIIAAAAAVSGEQA